MPCQMLKGLSFTNTWSTKPIRNVGEYTSYSSWFRTISCDRRNTVLILHSFEVFIVMSGARNDLEEILKSRVRKEFHHLDASASLSLYLVECLKS